jgi:hypothetical protein
MIVGDFEELCAERTIEYVVVVFLVSELIRFCSLSRKVRSWVEVKGTESLDADMSRVMMDLTWLNSWPRDPNKAMHFSRFLDMLPIS